MNNQNISEEERHEAATEESATVGCPSLGINKLPGGFDGAEPANRTVAAPATSAVTGRLSSASRRGGDGTVLSASRRGGDGTASEEARQKVEQAVVRQRQKLTQIADIALAAEAKSNSEHVRLGTKYLENAEALCKIRELVGPRLTFEEELAEDRTAAALSGRRGNGGSVEAPAAENGGGTVLSASRRGGDGTVEKTQSEILREEARQKRKIHWADYITKVDVCAMGKTEQNGKVYEVRIAKRTEIGEYTCATCKVNGKRVMDVKFTGSAWMLKRILTEGMQALVNFKAKKKRDLRRNYAKRKAAAAKAAGEVK